MTSIYDDEGNEIDVATLSRTDQVGIIASMFGGPLLDPVEDWATAVIDTFDDRDVCLDGAIKASSMVIVPLFLLHLNAKGVDPASEEMQKEVNRVAAGIITELLHYTVTPDTNPTEYTSEEVH